MGVRVHPSGLVIAGIGFFLTRFTVTLALYENPVRFYLAGVVPLVLGLGLAAFGVALAVADVDASLVRTTAAWCIIGATAMLMLVLLTLLGSTTGGLPDVATVRSRSYLSNFLIGGSVGGTLTGLYAARNRRQRVELGQHANRLEVLNRLLRHEVLNALTVIRGYATLGDRADHDARRVIEERSTAIEQTIDEVKHLARSVRTGQLAGTPVDLGACLERSLAAVRREHPHADIDVAGVPDEVAVLADDRLAQAFTNLIENAVVHGAPADPTVSVTATVGRADVRVAVRDTGPGLPESKQALLETGAIESFDNPRMGFGLNVVRLIVESYRGSIETDVSAAGTTVTVVLPRATTASVGVEADPTAWTGVRPAVPSLAVTLGAAMLAGVCYGIVARFFGSSVAGIGIFYGTVSPVVGWITHEFHSAVFAFVFAGLVEMAPAKLRDTLPGNVAIGIGWAVVLWVVAAGIIAPIWLRLLGYPTSIPNLTVPLLASHLAWGISLAVFTALGQRHVTPRLAELGARLPD